MIKSKIPIIENLCEDENDCWRSLLVGKICRQKFTPEFFARCKNPAAPDESEEFVRKLVINSVNKMDKYDILIIDGVPRKPSQVRWILETFPDLHNTFLHCFCEEKERVRRIKARDVIRGDLQLANARYIQEDHNLLRTIEELLLNNRHDEMTTIDLTSNLNYDTIKETFFNIPMHIMHVAKDCIDTGEVEGVVLNDSVEYMLGLNNIFSDITLEKCNQNSKKLFNSTCKVDEIECMEEAPVWIKRFVTRTIDELHELLREMPDAWWSKDKIKLNRIRVEMIDAWHFMMSAINAMGFTGKTFTRTYLQKRAVNLTRQAIGYTKRQKQKDDDLHIGKFNEHIKS